MIQHYVLRNGDVVETDLLTWAMDMQRGGHWLMTTDVPPYRISTILDGTSYIGAAGHRCPLFETKVFHQGHDIATMRDRDQYSARRTHLDAIHTYVQTGKPW